MRAGDPITRAGRLLAGAVSLGAGVCLGLGPQLRHRFLLALAIATCAMAAYFFWSARRGATLLWQG